MARGKFIAFEGIDGSGKSTQVEMLTRALISGGRQVVCAREPGGTNLGENIRNILLRTDSTKICSRAEVMLYAAARVQLVEERLAPALGAGITVVMDRYTDSTLAYQGHGRGLPLAWLRELNIFATEFVVPDLTILLDLDPLLAFARLSRAADRLEMAGPDFFGRVRRGYLELAAGNPKKYLVLDAGLPMEELHAIILNNVQSVIFKKDIGDLRGECLFG